MEEYLHPRGSFDGEVVDHGFSQAQNGNPQVFVKLQSELAGTITAYLALTDRAIEHTVKKLRACGFEGDDFAELEDGTLLVGNKVNYTVDHDTYDGKTRAKVGWINHPDGNIQRIDIRQHNLAMLNDALKQQPAATKKPKQTAPNTSGEPF